MKINFKKFLTVGVAAFALMLNLSLLGQTSMAVDNLSMKGGASSAKGQDQSNSLFGDGDGQGGIFKTITDILLFIIGAVSVIMLIIGGIRYTTSGGDQGAVKSAKDTILYAIVGIVVAILAYAVVNFVITGLVGKDGS